MGKERRKERKEKKERKERKKGRKCTCMHCTRCGAVLCTAAVSCHVLFVFGALWSVTVAEDTHLPALRARLPQPHAPYCSSLPVGSCRGSEGFRSILLGFFGFASSGRVTPFSRVSQDPEPGTNIRAA